MRFPQASVRHCMGLARFLIARGPRETPDRTTKNASRLSSEGAVIMLEKLA